GRALQKKHGGSDNLFDDFARRPDKVWRDQTVLPSERRRMARVIHNHPENRSAVAPGHSSDQDRVVRLASRIVTANPSAASRVGKIPVARKFAASGLPS